MIPVLGVQEHSVAPVLFHESSVTASTLISEQHAFHFLLFQFLLDCKHCKGRCHVCFFLIFPTGYSYYKSRCHSGEGPLGRLCSVWVARSHFFLLWRPHKQSIGAISQQSVGTLTITVKWPFPWHVSCRVLFWCVSKPMHPHDLFQGHLWA